MRNGINKKFVVWKLVVLVVTIYAAIFIPLKLAFPNFPFGNDIPDWALTFVFLTDFIINVIQYKENRKDIDSPQYENKAGYQSTLLISDLLAAIPFFLLSTNPVFQLFRLLKLSRLFHSLRNVLHFLMSVSRTYTLVNFIFWLTLATNWLACGWNMLLDSNANQSFENDYIDALYWTITTITTVGYGDIIPLTNAQKLYAVFVQILGFGVFTFAIGTVASRLMRKDPARVKYEENIEGLASLIHYKTLPGNLRNRILNFYRYMLEKRLGYDETAFLESLPESLQTEVALHLKKDVIEKVSIFNNASEGFKREISLLLKPVFLTPGDYIFKAGDEADKMYFVVNGELNVLVDNDNKILSTMTSGDFFGEIALFKNQNRTASIKAISYCDIYSLDKQSFDKVINRYPRLRAEIENICIYRESNYTQ